MLRCGDSAPMDNLTHTLLAITLARAGGKRLGPHATGLLVAAGNVPDIDAVALLDSTVTYLDWHRGITHSLAASPLVALAVVGGFVLGRKLTRSHRPFGVGRAFLVAWFGVVFGHLLLDWSTNYGTRLLLPFSDHRLSWGAVPIVDLWLWLVLAAALTLPSLFRLISEEIGAPHTGGWGAAWFAVAFLLAWFGFRGLCHARALAVLDAHVYKGLEPRQVGVLADFGNPFRWNGVVETAETWEVVKVNLLEEFDPRRSRTYYPPESSLPLEAAHQSRTGKIFLNFARFPYSYVEPTERGYEVVLRDLRFEPAFSGRKGFVARIVLDQDLTVIREQFQFRPSEAVR